MLVKSKRSCWTLTPEIKLYRPLIQGLTGTDVDAAKRCVYHQLQSREPHKRWWEGYAAQSTAKRQKFGRTFKQHLVKAQGQLGVMADGVFGQNTLHAMYAKDRVDVLSEQLFIAAKPNPNEVRFDKMLASMRWMSEHTPGYQLGGGHGISLSEVSAYRKLDCSSSTSKAMFDGGMWDDKHAARVSWEFDDWGVPGKGEMFTIYYNSEHVWTRLYDTRYWRFDTSPHGDGGRGPKLRYIPRFSSSFTPRHWPGL